ncbi:snake venom metalloprotease inhibitor 02D01-like [Schistocerca americana]|uniref:snake venom metalloprotease inhibitor 02D01-like n=1 Tax=Schistocerca americana TaxID=7009 RepID=UPI001F4FD9AA|nr:snake venom metalloprotease inhibitor 02D01-like [Schistocerca americana]
MVRDHLIQAAPDAAFRHDALKLEDPSLEQVIELARHQSPPPAPPTQRPQPTDQLPSSSSAPPQHPMATDEDEPMLLIPPMPPSQPWSPHRYRESWSTPPASAGFIRPVQQQYSQFLAELGPAPTDLTDVHDEWSPARPGCGRRGGSGGSASATRVASPRCCRSNCWASASGGGGGGGAPRGASASGAAPPNGCRSSRRRGLGPTCPARQGLHLAASHQLLRPGAH